MYLRTTKRTNKNGSSIEYYQLAHNVRHPETGKPVAKIIHSFGRADQLDHDQLVRLCRSIARVWGVEVRDPIADQAAIAEETGLFDGLSIKTTSSLGCPMVIEILWERQVIKKALEKVAAGKKKNLPYERALLAMVANRLCEPESKLGAWDRWLSKVYLPSCRGLKLRQMSEVMDFLQQHADKVEETVFFQVADLFNLEVDLIFYDTTTASFHVDMEDDPKENENTSLRKYGRAKRAAGGPRLLSLWR